MKKITLISSVVNGNLKRNRNKIREAIAAFEGKEIELTIQKKRKVRSNPQNRYYFGCLLPIVQGCIKDAWGEIWSIEKCHEFLKHRFLFEEKVNTETGEICHLPKSTTECTTVEFEEYQMQCREFTEEWFSTIIPLPNEELQLEI